MKCNCIVWSSCVGVASVSAFVAAVSPKSQARSLGVLLVSALVSLLLQPLDLFVVCVATAAVAISF